MVQKKMLSCLHRVLYLLNKIPSIDKIWSHFLIVLYIYFEEKFWNFSYCYSYFSVCPSYGRSHSPFCRRQRLEQKHGTIYQILDSRRHSIYQCNFSHCGDSSHDRREKWYTLQEHSRLDRYVAPDLIYTLLNHPL